LFISADVIRVLSSAFLERPIRRSRTLAGLLYRRYCNIEDKFRHYHNFLANHLY
ncbi:unnamed protein product, partial [Acanthoscelides obtectus]